MIQEDLTKHKTRLRKESDKARRIMAETEMSKEQKEKFRRKPYSGIPQKGKSNESISLQGNDEM